MHEKCMKYVNKLKKEGQNRLTSLRKEKFCKRFGGKRQKIDCGALPRWREKESLKKTFEKCLKRLSTVFLKTWFATFDWSKNTFDRSNQTVIFKQIKALFRSIENQNGSIELGRGSQNFWEKKHNFEKHKPNFENYSSKH